jgi:hypothetical protein
VGSIPILTTRSLLGAINRPTFWTEMINDRSISMGLNLIILICFESKPINTLIASLIKIDSWKDSNLLV